MAKSLVARADSSPTLSKSCSDKLALKQCTSLLSSLTSLLISPKNAYIDTLILPSSQYRPAACERAFGPTGRMKSVATKKWSKGYTFHPIQIKPTDLEFNYSRRSAKVGSQNLESKGSNISAVWTPRLQETLINGVLQGRKQTDAKGASALSRNRMQELLLDIVFRLESSMAKEITGLGSYAKTKRAKPLEVRWHVKNDAKMEALKGWNDGAG